ncbi:sigma-70 family RNA polymerase sigma factor [Priestia megaterium]|uniref:sigma-70 family RNA polymerase sigma factor n=1 Tax=Priestia megaterium TaxID=1404 RepID=UPI0012B7740B|nr:sigma-70 family RNA polymerase sigma factor [Priestia megaterium]
MDNEVYFYNKYKKRLQEPVVSEFLHDSDFYNLFKKAISQPNRRNRDILDKEFRKYYRKVKIVKYISKLIHFYSIDYDKKNSLHKKRYITNLDEPSINLQSDNSTTKIEVLASQTPIEVHSLDNDFKDVLEEEKIQQAINMLPKKNKEILKYIYIQNLKNKEISKIMNISEQLVSYTHKSSLKKIRNFLKKEKYL